MSPSTPARVLAVSPGARGTGVAAIGRHSELRRFEVIGLRLQGSLHDKSLAFRDRFDKVVEEERPQIVVLERIAGARRTEETEQIARTARQVVALHGIPLREESLHDSRVLLAAGQPAVRITAHRALCRRFPQVAKCTKQPFYSKFYGYTDQYWERAFAALALAVVEVEAGSRVVA